MFTLYARHTSILVLPSGSAPDPQLLESCVLSISYTTGEY
nr:MAG TPA: hypothetical protein [Caudoviricetes sp.]